MLEGLKRLGTNFVLKTKDLFTSSESIVYVKDLRKVMMHEGRKCQYPKNYDQVVKSGKIIEQKDSNGRPVKDEKGNSKYQLVYNGNKFNLVPITEVDNRSYFTIDFLADQKKNKDIERYDGYYKLFGFSKLDLRKCLPIFEIDTDLLKLTNSSLLAKKGCYINNKTDEVDEKDRDEKGRNGELLYTSDYKKLSTHFSEIRDQNGNLELDKSLISVPIVFVTSLAKVCAKLLTSLPIKLGERLISKQNPIAKSFGYLLFTLAMVVKNLVNVGATILKVPILLFVANEKKYADAYYTMWKYQLEECWKEARSDFSVIETGKRLKSEKKNYPDLDPICGTKKELDARKPGIEKYLEKQAADKEVSKNNEVLKGPEKEQSKGNETLSDKRGHVDKVISRRNSLQDEKIQLPPY